MIYHTPVLLEDSINGLNIKPGGIYADLTFGGGGHSKSILEKLDKNGRLIAFDQDTDASSEAAGDDRFTLVNSNFRFLRNFLRYYGIEKLDGLLADLGISSHQIDVPERGFSFMKAADLDMRMNQNSSLTASDIVNTYTAEELVRIFREYGELQNAKALAGKIVSMREVKKITSTTELAEVLSPLIPPPVRNKTLARIFQSLRIEVNGEISALKDLLIQLPAVITQGGRVVFITYHSLEDRLVKNFLKTGRLEGDSEKDFFGNVSVPFRILNKNGTTPGQEEIASNPRARSARMRIAERTIYG